MNNREIASICAVAIAIITVAVTSEKSETVLFSIVVIILFCFLRVVDRRVKKGEEPLE
jgi:ABC-type antimicrobial peptide transport system permease subunit